MSIDPEDPDYTVERVLEQDHVREALNSIRGKVPTHELAAFAEGRVLIDAFESDRPLVAANRLNSDEWYRVVDALACEVAEAQADERWARTSG